jgi:hypothetical protein
MRSTILMIRPDEDGPSRCLRPRRGGVKVLEDVLEEPAGARTVQVAVSRAIDQASELELYQDPESTTCKSGTWRMLPRETGKYCEWESYCACPFNIVYESNPRPASSLSTLSSLNRCRLDAQSEKNLYSGCCAQARSCLVGDRSQLRKIMQGGSLCGCQPMLGQALVSRFQ